MQLCPIPVYKIEKSETVFRALRLKVRIVDYTGLHRIRINYRGVCKLVTKISLYILALYM